MLRREGDGCPLTGALQLVGDKWTLLVVRELARGPRRTTELIERLHPISSRTLVARLHDMRRDQLIERRDFGGSPPHVEYVLTERGRVLLPLLEHLRRLGETLGCNKCDDRLSRSGDYCEVCPRRTYDEQRPAADIAARPAAEPTRQRPPSTDERQPRRHEPDTPIVLL